MANNNKKQIAKKQNPWVLLAKGIVLAGITYALVSWTIDSGAIPVYILATASAYMTLRTLVQVVKNII